MNNRALLYAAELSFPRFSWEFKGEYVYISLSHLRLPDKPEGWSFTYNRPCCFDPIAHDMDWVALREGLDKKGISLVYVIETKEYLIEIDYFPGPRAPHPLDTVEPNKCPRTLALDICAVLAGEDDEMRT